MDKNLYFSTSGPVTIQAPHPVASPLGEIIYAGTKWDSQATYAHAPPPDYFRVTPHFLLVYTLEGEADYRDSTGVKTVLRQGSLIWSVPGVDQSYGPRPGSRWSEFFLWFSGPLFECWRDCNFPGQRSMVLTLKPVHYMLENFRTIVVPEEGGAAESDLTRLCRLQLILAEAVRQQAAATLADEDAVWRTAACQALRKGMLTRPSLEEIARGMNMSYSLFRRKFTALTGKSPGRFRNDEIMSAACRMLTETTQTIAEIAAKFGFNDSFHFSRRFKETIGISPTNFRRHVGK